MSKTITISLQTLHSLYSKFLNKIILPYLPQNLQNQINTLINFKSPIDVYRHLTNLINNISKDQINNQKNMQQNYHKIISKSNQKNNTHNLRYLNQSEDQFKINRKQSVDKYQTKQRNQRTSPNKRGLKITNSSQNYQESIIENRQKNLLNELKPVNINNNIIHNKISNNITSSSDKIHQILVKKSSTDSRSSLTANHNYQFKIRRDSDSQNKVDQKNHLSQGKQTTGSKEKHTNIVEQVKLMAPPLIPRNDNKYDLNSYNKNYSGLPSKYQNYGNNSQNLTIENRSPLNKNLKLIIKNIQQVFRQNQKKIERYDKAYTSPSSSASSFGHMINNHNINTYNNGGVNVKKY